MSAASEVALPTAPSSPKFVCAWCRDPLTRHGVGSGEPVEHFGICKTCRVDQLAKDRRRSRPTPRRRQPRLVVNER